MEAKNPQLVRVRSHSVSLGFNHGFGVESEECYSELTAEWRGETVSVTMRADRYEHSSGWSDWRITRYSFDPGQTDTAASKLADACRPLVEAWLASDAYGPSRQRAFAWMIRNHLRDERYTTDRSTELLTRYTGELAYSDASRLGAALQHLDEFLRLIERGNDA